MKNHKSRKITKLLVANRAEISLRIQKTCQQMGISTVAIYAEDDKELPFVHYADEAYCLGAGTPSETYLNQDKILDIAKRAGVDAIHPGYGFLSEREKFCQAIMDAGMIFIGPSPKAIALMGDKIVSKRKAQELGVPLIPGYQGDRQDPDYLLEQANDIGYPLLIKASAGGGGKGMRIVRDKKDFLSLLDMAKSEALKSFGDDRVLIEKFIERPRHIEVQVFGDQHGQHVYLFERECSVQRRYQKIIEESPSASLTAALRKQMGEAAVALAKGIDYHGAGTVEFILDDANQKQFFFLEMNTRLQVEHPVTEMVTQQDLVQWQIKVAQGEKLPLLQDQLTQTGWAIEARLYAEDPYNQFLPTAGKIIYQGHSERPGVRLDLGYDNANTVGSQYDPMIGKIIAFGANRDQARHRLVSALADTPHAGIMNNNFFLQQLLLSEKFQSNDIYTNSLDQKEIEFSGDEMNDDQLTDWIKGNIDLMHLKPFAHAFDSASKDPWHAHAKDQSFVISSMIPSTHGLILKLKPKNLVRKKPQYQGHNTLTVTLYKQGVRVYANCAGKVMLLYSEKDLPQKKKMSANSSKEANASTHYMVEIESPMPGKIFKILKESGSKVESGDDILLLEAMKMEHPIKAPTSGVVSNILKKIGEQVSPGEILIEFQEME